MLIIPCIFDIRHRTEAIERLLDAGLRAEGEGKPPAAGKKSKS